MTGSEKGDRHLERPSRPDDELGGLFEDLEQQAAGFELAERDAELADRARGEYASVTFGSRVHASLGREVALALSGGALAEGRLTRAGADWCVVSATGEKTDWLVRLAAVLTARGMSPRAVPELARPAVARLRFGAALHGMAEEFPELLVHLSSTGTLRVHVVRIGTDFLEADVKGVEPAAPKAVLLPFTSICAVRPG